MHLSFVPWWLTLAVAIAMSAVFLTCLWAWHRLPEETCSDAASTADILLDKDGWHSGG